MALQRTGTPRLTDLIGTSAATIWTRRKGTSTKCATSTQMYDGMAARDYNDSTNGSAGGVCEGVRGVGHDEEERALKLAGKDMACDVSILPF
jgi:hypothetical protein